MYYLRISTNENLPKVIPEAFWTSLPNASATVTASEKRAFFVPDNSFWRSFYFLVLHPMAVAVLCISCLLPLVYPSSRRRHSRFRQSDRTSFRPSLKTSSFFRDNLPSCSVKNDLSNVKSWETLTTEFWGSPPSFFNSWKFPGTSASLKFGVIMATITVWILLWLNSLEEITTTGRRYPGSEPLGSSKDAHHISPLSTTSFPLELSVTAFHAALYQTQSRRCK